MTTSQSVFAPLCMFSIEISISISVAVAVFVYVSATVFMSKYVHTSLHMSVCMYV